MIIRRRLSPCQYNTTHGGGQPLTIFRLESGDSFLYQIHDGIESCLPILGMGARDFEEGGDRCGDQLVRHGPVLKGVMGKML